MKRFFLLSLFCTLLSLGAWAETVTFTYSDYNGEGTTSTGSTYTMDDKTYVSIGDTKFWGNNSYNHFYAGGTITVTPKNGATITKIAITTTGTSYNGYQSSGTYTASTGSVAKNSSNNAIVEWTGSATSAFTLAHTKQIRWTSIVVTYSTSGGSTTQPTALSVPSNLQSSNVTTTGATLSWNAVANASSYTVKIGETEYTGVTTTSYSATGLTASTQYTWTVKAVGDGTNYTTSEYASNATFTTEAEQGGGEQGGEEGGDDDNLVITYDFNKPANYPSNFPTSGTNVASALHCTISGNEIIINAPTSYYRINSTTENCGLFFGKTSTDNGAPKTGTAYLGFPAKQGYKLVKVVATTTTTCAKDIPVNIYTTSLEMMSTAISTEATTKKEMEFTLSNSTANTEYWLTAGGASGKNLQFDNIVLTYEPVAGENPDEPGTDTPSDENFITFVATDGTDYYATFSSDRVVGFEDVLVSDDEESMASVKVYAVGVVDDAIVLTDLYGTHNDGTYTYVPKNTGVLLKYHIEDGTMPLSVPFIYADSWDGYLNDISSDNDLRPASAAKETDGSYKFYMLGYSDSNCTPASLGFYWGADNGAAFISREGSAYLAVPAATAATPRRFLFGQTDTATDVENIEAATAVKFFENGTLYIQKNGRVYNVAGMIVK